MQTGSPTCHKAYRAGSSSLYVCILWKEHPTPLSHIPQSNYTQTRKLGGRLRDAVVLKLTPHGQVKRVDNEAGQATSYLPSADRSQTTQLYDVKLSRQEPGLSVRYYSLHQDSTQNLVHVSIPYPPGTDISRVRKSTAANGILQQVSLNGVVVMELCPEQSSAASCVFGPAEDAEYNDNTHMAQRPLCRRTIHVL
ncbi:hypothetical protein BaRGS_00008197 [Batillaria attramentaria]|uniref:Uncharacterized protein n=1 Tax=Batillaria attramentaria TaxID=370345 RepID=A0ABD0LNJ7_9CAEN